ncbi:MAG: FAD-dependent 5-carboxymethylaminomethyl-2-thiouridine(34) oxidoreductase MnmC [Candidatus Wenzhouxiangella sp. M2_3B_020]
MQPDLDPISPARVTLDGETPFAPDYGDGYFSRIDGPGESRAVFLAGNRLEPRFEGLDRNEQFTIGETGFGTGLNALQAAELFSGTAPDGARLSLLSAERHPLARDDLERVLSRWPKLGPFSRRLLEGYPPPTPGFHRVRLGERVELVLMLGDAAEMWSRQPAAVDAWFLDGFAPARNAAMWSPRLFGLLAARSRPGCTLASFTVAGSVRRALTEAGFTVERKPGFGDKRHRLEGERPGTWSAQRVRRGSALVVGAGLAGATTARALAERGWGVRMIEPSGIAEGASGNHAGVVYTTPSGVATPQNRFYQSSYLRALRWLARHECERRDIGRLDGVVQLVNGDRHRRKLHSATASGHWPAGLMEWLDDDRVLLPGGGVLRPAAWCRLLLDHPDIERCRDRVEGVDGDTVRLASGRRAEADATILCTGAATPHLPGLPALPLKPIRGQVTECRATAASRRWRRAQCHDGYLTPAVDGIHCVGATFDLHDETLDPRDDDDARNLRQLRDRLPARWQALGAERAEIVGHRVGLRCQASDFLPLAGPVGASQDPAMAAVWLNVAHGSRGITGTPVTAECIADSLSGLPAAVDTGISDALAPQRFAKRRSGHDA